MRVLSKAFSRLKTTLPWVPPDTKLSKLDTLRLASSYIAHLRQILANDKYENGYIHPVNLVSSPSLLAGPGDPGYLSPDTLVTAGLPRLGTFARAPRSSLTLCTESCDPASDLCKGLTWHPIKGFPRVFSWQRRGIP
ncbi:Transcription factor 21 [Lemmus lemmus]